MEDNITIEQIKEVIDNSFDKIEKKILNYSEFIELPKGTFFSFYDSDNPDEINLCIKGESFGKHDFILYDSGIWARYGHYEYDEQFVILDPFESKEGEKDAN